MDLGLLFACLLRSIRRLAKTQSDRVLRLPSPIHAGQVHSIDGSVYRCTNSARMRNRNAVGFTQTATLHLAFDTGKQYYVLFECIRSAAVPQGHEPPTRGSSFPPGRFQTFYQVQ